MSKNGFNPENFNNLKSQVKDLERRLDHSKLNNIMLNNTVDRLAKQEKSLYGDLIKYKDLFDRTNIRKYIWMKFCLFLEKVIEKIIKASRVKCKYCKSDHVIRSYNYEYDMHQYRCLDCKRDMV